MKIWEVKSVDYLSPRLDELLGRGWKPFAVIAAPQGGLLVFLRRRRKVKVS